MPQLPNDCIAGEANYRLFEGASCGCLMLLPDIGGDQNSQFAPGKDFEPYANVLELIEK